jgi:hypothetical protein
MIEWILFGAWMTEKRNRGIPSHHPGIQPKQPIRPMPLRIKVLLCALWGLAIGIAWHPGRTCACFEIWGRIGQ